MMQPKLTLYPNMGLSFKDQKLVKDKMLDEEALKDIVKWEHRVEIYNKKEAQYISELLEQYGMRIYNSHPYRQE